MAESYKMMLNSERELVRSCGTDNGRRIGLRLQNIRDASTLDELSKIPQTRIHELTGDRNERISVDVRHPYRLILVSNHEETPRKPAGGLEAMDQSIFKNSVFGTSTDPAPKSGDGKTPRKIRLRPVGKSILKPAKAGNSPLYQSSI